MSATVTFIPVGAGGGVTGVLKPGKVRTRARFTLRLSNVTVAGLPAGVGGYLAGTYTIPPFANCGLTTAIINLLVPGPDNTLRTTISNGRIV